MWAEKSIETQYVVPGTSGSPFLPQLASEDAVEPGAGPAHIPFDGFGSLSNPMALLLEQLFNIGELCRDAHPEVVCHASKLEIFSVT